MAPELKRWRDLRGWRAGAFQNVALALALRAVKLEILQARVSVAEGGPSPKHGSRFGAARAPLNTFAGGSRIEGGSSSNCAARIRLRAARFHNVALALTLYIYTHHIQEFHRPPWSTFQTWRFGLVLAAQFRIGKTRQSG
eukprot:9493711-Pyramimonas_sp.AAC.1